MPVFRLTLCLLLALGAIAQDRAVRVETGLRPAFRIDGRPEQRWTIAERMMHHKTPAISISVIDGGEIQWSRSYGKASLETLFQAASISKPVAALTVLRLVAQGKLRLDQDVNENLKSWKVPPHSFGKPVTLRALLSHTAGTTVHGFPGYRAGAPVPTVAELLGGKGNTPAVVVDVEPGSTWRYSGGGYEIVQQLVEDVTRRPFAAVAKQLVLDRLDMTRSTYEQPLPEKLAANAAPAYDRNGKLIEGRWHTYPELAAAGLWTRPLDLAKALVGVQRAAAGNTKFLPAAITREMLTPVRGNYGLGWGIEGQDAKQWFGHGGANAGYRCVARAYTRLGKGAVIMTNSDNGHALANEILRSIAAEYGWPDLQVETKVVAPLGKEKLEAVAGKYDWNGAALTVSVAGDGLSVATPMGVFEFLPESETKFFPVTEGAPSMVLEKDATGRVTGFRAGNVSAKRVE